MPPVRDQAKVFGFFAFGLAGLMWLLTGGGSHAGCFALCCGMIPGLGVTSFVLTLREAGRKLVIQVCNTAAQLPVLEQFLLNPLTGQTHCRRAHATEPLT